MDTFKNDSKTIIEENWYVVNTKCNVINVCNNNSQQVARIFSLAHSNEVRSRFNAHKASLLTLQIEHSAERKPLYASRFRKLH